MKTKIILRIISAVVLLSVFASEVSQNSASAVPSKKRIVAAYVSARPKISPDPNYVTHINFAFGKVKRDTYDGVTIWGTKRLREIVALKEQNPNLKVILSIGGWGAGGFSEMASSDSTRNSFIEDCVRKCDEYNLDGIDIDWEFPGSSASGIKSSPEDKDNFTLLMKGLREALGKKRILSFASNASGKHANWKDVIKYLDYVNVMCYDMGRPPFHNAALYKSDMVRFSTEDAIEAHISKGIPAKKIVLGIPFYGHGNKKLKVNDYVGFRELPNFDQYEHKWDSTAMVPYIVNKKGEMLVTYDDEESIRLKCEYAINRGLLGVMYWEFSYDDSDQTLTKLSYETTKNSKKTSRKK